MPQACPSYGVRRVERHRPAAGSSPMLAARSRVLRGTRSSVARADERAALHGVVVLRAWRARCVAPVFAQRRARAPIHGASLGAERVGVEADAGRRRGRRACGRSRGATRDAVRRHARARSRPARAPCGRRSASSTTSPFARPSRSAVAGATSAALSQVSLVSGRGSSCSQPLFAKRPSTTSGSGRKHELEAVAPPVGAARRRDRQSAAHRDRRGAARRVRRRRRRAAHCCQNVSKSPLGARAAASARARGRSATAALAPEQRREHLVRGLAAVERRDQRLDDRRRAVERRARRPSSRGSAPRARASGRAARSRRRRGRGGRAAAPCSSALGEVEVGRRVVDRVAAEDEQQLDPPGVACRRRAPRSDAQLIVGPRLDRLGVDDRAARRCRAPG